MGVWVSLLLAARIGVVVTGPDPLACGALQHSLEERLVAVPDLVVAPTSTFATDATSAPIPRPNHDALVQAAAHFENARKAYYRGRSAQALEQLAAAHKIHESANAPSPTRVRVALWVAAIHFGDGNESEAARFVNAALRLNPDAQVDLTELQPSVARFVDEIRMTRTLHTVRVTGLPPRGKVRIDNRPVKPTFKVVEGSHRLWMWAPGYRAVERVIEVRQSSVERARLAPAIQTRDYATLRTRLRLDGLLVVDLNRNTAKATTYGARGIHVQQGRVKTKGEVAGLARWSAGRLQPTPVAVAETPTTSRFAWKLRTGTLVAHRVRSASPGWGALDFVGTGPRVDGEVTAGRFVAEAGVTWTYYGFSKWTGTVRDGTTGSFGGGSTTRARAALGYRLGHFTLTAGGVVVWHAAEEFRDVYGSLGLTSDHTRTGVDIALHGAVPIQLDNLTVEVFGAVSVAPLNRWIDRPAGQLGANPQVDPVLHYTAGLSMNPTARPWRLDLRYDHEAARVHFSGSATVPLDDGSVNNLVLTESVQTLTLAARWSFR